MATALKLLAALASFAILALLACGTRGAEAHTASFYPWWYAVGIDDVPVYFDSGFPGGRYRNRVVDGARQWTNVGRRMYFKVHRSPSIKSDADKPGDTAEAGYCPTPERDGRRVGMIHWSAIDGPGGTFGQTGMCWKGEPGTKSVKSFRIYLDRSEPWYSGTGDSQVRYHRSGRVENRLDLWSVATHELGHATGWYGHWDGRAAFCSLASEPGTFRTMCPGYLPGYERQRTLSGADKHVFRSQYAAR
jgi:hypothetical protein